MDYAGDNLEDSKDRSGSSPSYSRVLLAGLGVRWGLEIHTHVFRKVIARG